MKNKKGSTSLFIDLFVRISLISVVSAIVLIVIAYFQIDRTLEILRDQTVQEQAKNISMYLESNKGKNKILLNTSLDLRRFYARAGDTYQYIVLDDKGNRLFTSPIAFGDYFPEELDVVSNQIFDFVGPSGRKYVGFTMKTQVADKILYIQAAQTKEVANTFSDKVLDDFITRLALIGLPFYFFLVIITLLTLRQGLAPLHQSAKDVRDINLSKIDFRIDETQVPVEVLPFIKGINLTLSRLEKSVQEQRNQTENIAHELRTPLSILKTHIGTLDHTEQSQRLTEDIDSIIKMMNQMLDATHLDYTDIIEENFVDLAEILSQACQDFFPLFIRAQKKLVVSGIDYPVIVKGNRDMIYRAVRNLLDNALEYSPTKTPVEASLDNHTIRIRDYGRKIPEALHQSIFERFYKDNSSSPQKGGAGIGLSIVKKTMEIHGGSADLEVIKDRGNIFRLTFPTKNC